MLKLYHSPASRSFAFLWLLEEIGEPYEILDCTIKRRNGAGAPDAKNVHPEKRVPALVHDGELITEQLAIALYLTDMFPQNALGFSVGAARRGEYLSWLAFFAGEADPIYNTRMLYGDRLDAMSQRDQSRVTARVSSALAKSPFIMGERFTAADVLLSGPFHWDAALVCNDENIRAWLARLDARSAAVRATALDPFPQK